MRTTGKAEMHMRTILLAVNPLALENDLLNTHQHV